MKQLIFNDKLDFLKCHCQEPGFCPVFNRAMGVDPPDWEWCKRTSAEEREKYYALLKKAPPPAKKKIAELLVEFKDDPKILFLYYLTQHNRQHTCSIANEKQKEKNLKILEHLENQDKNNIDFENVEIFCLGHSKKQFDSIQDRSYIKKIDLNKIDAGQYSDNKWAESRAFLADLPSDNKDFVGFVTASWNIKYEPFSFIQNFHNWNNAKLLINSKPEDKIVLCADIFCPCIWISDRDSNSSILSHFIKDNAEVVVEKLLKPIGLEDYKHVKVPFGNQMIMHKSLLSEYKDYLSEFNVFKKVNCFVEKHINGNMYNCDDFIKSNYQYNRLHAYFMEMVSCFWFSIKDWLYIPNTERREDWYNQNAVASRIKEWDSKERFGL